MAETYQIQSETLYPSDIWNWTEEISDYPASEGYSLNLTLRQGDIVEVIKAEANGDDYEFTIPQSTTIKFLGGNLEWQYRISDGDSILKTIARGGKKIEYNLLQEQSDINFWEAQYKKAKVLYDALTARKVSEVSINGRSIKFNQREELSAIMGEAKRMVQKLSGTQIQKIKVRFQRT